MPIKTLEVQTFLETKTFGQLANEWGVYARCDSSGHKFSLNYDMQEFKPGFYPAEQCRGLILSSKKQIPHVNGKIDENFCVGKTEVMAYPFDKFYNEQEAHAAKIDWSDSKLCIENKLDGTLCILYWDFIKDEWCVATRSVPDADMPIDGRPELTFRKLFEKGVQDTLDMGFSDFTSYLPKGMTMLFELTSPYNRVYVDYKDTCITLLGGRDTALMMNEWNPKIWLSNYGFKIPTPEQWKLTSPEDVKAFVNGRKGSECEGAVVIDSNFRRIKIKNINWVLENSIKTSLGSSPRNLMRYVLSGTSDDMIALLPPDLCKELSQMQTGVSKLFKHVDMTFSIWKLESGGDRKHFASIVNAGTQWPAPYFKLWEGHYGSVSEYIKDLIAKEKLNESQIDKLIELTKGL